MNFVQVYGGYSGIFTAKGEEFLINTDDLPLVYSKHWYKMPSTGYLYTSEGSKKERKIIPLHSFLMNPKPGFEVDHINFNRADNRRSNLRVATRTENSRNRGPQKNNKSGFKGVFWLRSARRWIARIKVNSVPIHLGSFKDPKEAAKAYNQAAKNIFGDFAYLNPLE